MSDHTIEKTSSALIFGGRQDVYRHRSATLGCEMNVAVYLPPQIETTACPVLFWLSGLTCTEQNFITKAGAQRLAAELGFVIVAPDTSPRGCELEGEDDSYDFGSGAGFYVNATTEPWKKHYQMYDYIVEELPALIEKNFKVDPEKWGIFGHSMGGHGALTIGLRNNKRFKSISAFAPIVAPMDVPWGQKALAGYLGDDPSGWAAHDACRIVETYSCSGTILIDQGMADNFLEEQLQPERFEKACEQAGQALTLRKQDGYDHSYYFIASFIDDHLRHHAKELGL